MEQLWQLHCASQHLGWCRWAECFHVWVLITMHITVVHCVAQSVLTIGKLFASDKLITSSHVGNWWPLTALQNSRYSSFSLACCYWSIAVLTTWWQKTIICLFAGWMYTSVGWLNSERKHPNSSARLCSGACVVFSGWAAVLSEALMSLVVLPVICVCSMFTEVVNKWRNLRTSQ